MTPPPTGFPAGPRMLTCQSSVTAVRTTGSAAKASSPRPPPQALTVCGAAIVAVPAGGSRGDNNPLRAAG